MVRIGLRPRRSIQSTAGIYSLESAFTHFASWKSILYLLITQREDSPYRGDEHDNSYHTGGEEGDSVRRETELIEDCGSVVQDGVDSLHKPLEPRIPKSRTTGVHTLHCWKNLGC